MSKQQLSEKSSDPKFKIRPAEKAEAVFYVVETGAWVSEDVKVQIAEAPFAEGGIRAAYNALVHFGKNTKHPIGGSHACVIKIAKGQQKDEIYFLDVAMQMYAKWWADKYNQNNPPKKVTFVHAFVLKMVNRKTKDVYGAEDLIHGEYIKHSDNNGWVASSENNQPMRNTPHAFSHFTYEASAHRFIVVDIQGVADYYTDPQIHTADRKGFGLGNLGQEGINRFLETHQCNPLCQSMGLPPISRGRSLTSSGSWPQQQQQQPFQHIHQQFQQIPQQNQQPMPYYPQQTRSLTHSGEYTQPPIQVVPQQQQPFLAPPQVVPQQSRSLTHSGEYTQPPIQVVPQPYIAPQPQILPQQGYYTQPPPQYSPNPLHNSGYYQQPSPQQQQGSYSMYPVNQPNPYPYPPNQQK